MTPVRNCKNWCKDVVVNSAVSELGAVAILLDQDSDALEDLLEGTDDQIIDVVSLYERIFTMPDLTIFAQHLRADNVSNFETALAPTNDAFLAEEIDELISAQSMVFDYSWEPANVQAVVAVDGTTYNVVFLNGNYHVEMNGVLFAIIETRYNGIHVLDDVILVSHL